MALSDPVLRERLAADPWTGHNIRLSPAVTTLPGAPDFLRTDRRLLGILRTLSVLYRGELAGLRVADLGCLEGGFALALAQQGARVLAVDAREANLDKVRLLIEHFGLANLEVACADVKEFTRERHGEFDVVLCLGLLYHLDRPVAWLRQVAAMTRAVLIVDTHMAPEEDAIEELDPALGRLGPLEDRDDGGAQTRGRWFPEGALGANRSRERWTAFSNAASFWLDKASLVAAFRHAGFESIFEQKDWIADAHAVYGRKLSRAVFVALKSAAFAPALPPQEEAPASFDPAIGGVAAVAAAAPVPLESWRRLRRIDAGFQDYLRRRRLGRCLRLYWRLRSGAGWILRRRR